IRPGKRQNEIGRRNPGSPRWRPEHASASSVHHPAATPPTGGTEMLTQTPTHVPRKGRQAAWGQLAMTAVTLALVSGVALWQARSTGTTPAPTSTALPVGGIGEPNAVQAAAHATSSPQPATGDTPIAGYLYLVDSEEQAGVVRAEAAELNAIL